MKDTYKILGTKNIFRGQKVNIDLEKIKLPNGNIVEWEVIAFPDFSIGIPLTEKNEVLFVREWRQGPRNFLLHLPAGRGSREEGLANLKREVMEEMGIVGGKYDKLIEFPNGTRVTGKKSLYVVSDFRLDEPKRDENEIQEVISLPLKGLFQSITKNYIATSDILLIAKLIEENYG